jgi:transposase
MHQSQALPEIFSTRRGRVVRDEEALQARLYQQIGRLKVELDWLKKKQGLRRDGEIE